MPILTGRRMEPKWYNIIFLQLPWRMVNPTICHTLALALRLRLITLLMFGRAVNLVLA